MTADEVFAAILNHYGTPGQEWAVFKEVRCATGFDSLQSIDALAFNLWPSKGLGRVAYEIKISRSDWQRELKEPYKRHYALTLAHQFYFAVPAGLVTPEEVPPDCGLAWVEAGAWRGRGFKVVKPAPKHEVKPLPENFMAVLARRAAKAEANLRKMGMVSVPPAPKDMLK